MIALILVTGMLIRNQRQSLLNWLIAGLKLLFLPIGSQQHFASYLADVSSKVNSTLFAMLQYSFDFIIIISSCGFYSFYHSIYRSVAVRHISVIMYLGLFVVFTFVSFVVVIINVNIIAISESNLAHFSIIFIHLFLLLFAIKNICKN